MAGEQKIEKFEDVVAWQRARALTREIAETIRDGGFAKDTALGSELLHAGITTMASIAEGFERRGRGELGQFLAAAKGANTKIRCCLYVAQDAGYLDKPKFDQLYLQATELAQIVRALRVQVERRRQAQSARIGQTGQGRQQLRQQPRQRKQ
jgi:four helix bundle protein